MINRSSRYYDGYLYQAKDINSDNYNIVVDRKFPDTQKITYVEYTWVDGDSLGRLAYEYIGQSKYWWKIMEANPEISDPMSIEPGQVIRLPRGI